MGEINWSMIGVMFGIASAMGAVLFAAFKSVFITKSKIYDDKGITIFLPRDELKELCAERRKAVNVTFDKAITELEKATEDIVPRHEWISSYKAREKRQDDNQVNLNKRFDDLSNSLENLQAGQVKIEKELSNLHGFLIKKEK